MVTFRVTGQDLVFDFVDIAIDRGEELFPSNSQCLHGELSVAVLEHHRLLNALIQLLQFVHVSLVGVDILFVFLQSHQLVLQRTLNPKPIINNIN